jgi:hypothetical protein
MMPTRARGTLGGWVKPHARLTTVVHDTVPDTEYGLVLVDRIGKPLWVGFVPLVLSWQCGIHKKGGRIT